MDNVCTVCGAIFKAGTKIFTCDIECSKARRRGLTRAESLKHDMDRQVWGDDEPVETTRLRIMRVRESEHRAFEDLS